MAGSSKLQRSEGEGNIKKGDLDVSAPFFKRQEKTIEQSFSTRDLAVDASENVFDLLAKRAAFTPPRSRRVFVNRSLRMDRIAWIGFDMDFTLLCYQSKPMGELLYCKSLEQLVGLGYPERLLTDLSYDPLRVVRGTLIDKKLGNILQMDRHRHVCIGYHGHHRLTKEERKGYRAEPVSLTDADRFRQIDTQFEIPEASLFCDLVQWYVQNGQKIEYTKLHQDVRNATDQAHIKGTIHNAIKENLERYINVEDDLVKMLQRLLMVGKKLFLLTNSDWDYTDIVMSYVLEQKGGLDRNWRELFELVLVRARKPKFFVSENPFEILDPESGEVLGETQNIGKEQLLRGGNLEALSQRLGGLGDQIIYVGDHVFGDILRSKKTSTWRTMLVLEELEVELERMQDSQELELRLDRLDDRRTYLDAEIHYQQMLLEKLGHFQNPEEANGHITIAEHVQIHAIQKAEGNIKQLQLELDTLVAKIIQLHSELGIRFNPYWGKLFREGHEFSHLGEQIRTYACIYTSRVCNLLFYSPEQYFRSPAPPLPHEMVGTQEL